MYFIIPQRESMNNDDSNLNDAGYVLWYTVSVHAYYLF